MVIFNYALIALIFVLAPALALWLCRRVSFLEKLGPIMVLYAFGIILGNIPWKPAEMPLMQELGTSISIPLAIPMMLYGCNFSRGEAGLQLKIVASGFLSVCAAVVIGYLLFGQYIAEGDKVGGIITGMYTGGTLNAAALQTIFKIKSETYILINSYDIVISFIYFVFLFSFGIRMFRRLYGQSATVAEDGAEVGVEQAAAQASNPYKPLLKREGRRQLGKILGVTLIVVALSAAATLLVPDDWFMVVFILTLTTLGVVCSFISPIRRLELSYDVGMYFIYIFSITIASMADFSNLDLVGGVNQLAFMVVAVFISLFIHALLCRLMRVDADSMMISSVAFINSPPFVPMASAAMHNKKALVTGLGAGIVGYALGNHLGVLMSQLLSML